MVEEPSLSLEPATPTLNSWTLLIMVKIYWVGHEYSGAYHWIRTERERAEALIEEDEVVGFIGRDKPVQERCRLFVLLHYILPPNLINDLSFFWA